MELLSQLLPIIIYFLLIIVIIVGIILGIKLIVAIDKALRLIDNVNEKVDKVAPIFNTFGIVSDKFNDIVITVVKAVENLIVKLFLKNKNKKEMEIEEDE